MRTWGVVQEPSSRARRATRFRFNVGLRPATEQTPESCKHSPSLLLNPTAEPERPLDDTADDRLTRHHRRIAYHVHLSPEGTKMHVVEGIPRFWVCAQVVGPNVSAQKRIGTGRFIRLLRRRIAA